MRQKKIAKKMPNRYIKRIIFTRLAALIGYLITTLTLFFFIVKTILLIDRGF